MGIFNSILSSVLVPLLLISCANSDLSEDISNDALNTDTNENIFIPNYTEKPIEPYLGVDFSTKTEIDINNWLDSTDFIGINDFGYRIFDTLFSCEQANQIALNFESNSEKALYAFYKLTFGDCRISTVEAINWIEKFESCSDTLQIWMSPWERGDRTLAEEAADAIWQNNLFPMSPEQDKHVAEIRNL